MERETALEPVIGAQLRERGPDHALVELARRQHSTVARRQLIALGFGRHAVAHMVQRGRLHPVHRGVYAVGQPRLTRRGVWMAAVLAAGPGAVLSHYSAAALWKLGRDPARHVDVSVARKLCGRCAIHIHVTQLADDETTIVDGIPVTTVARTLLDLGALLTRHQLEIACNEAEIMRLADRTSLRALLDRYPRRRGTRNLRAILAAQELGTAVTRSTFERDFLAFLNAMSLPRPRVNFLVAAGGRDHLCDMVWPEARLIVELDGNQTHATRAAFEADRARDRALQVAGWRVVRITWRQLQQEPQAVAADLRRLLAPIAS